MPDPTPDRGVASVSDIERILRPNTPDGDFKYSSTTRPTIQEVCDEIDIAYDSLVFDCDTNGIVTPAVNDKIVRGLVKLNAYLASYLIEVEFHTSEGQNQTERGRVLKKIYDDEWKKFFLETSLPANTATESNVTTDRPLVHLKDYMSFTNAELKQEFDSDHRDPYFKINKKY